MDPIQCEVCYESFHPADLDEHMEKHERWKNIEKAFLKATHSGKGIFVNAETIREQRKEMIVYWVNGQDEEFDLFDYQECHIWGVFNEEMITGNDALNTSLNFSDEEVTAMGNIILDESNWVDIQWVEIEDDYPKGSYHHTDRLIVIKKGQEIPKGATGKFLLDTEDGYVYEDGIPIIKNSEIDEEE